jgi:hypothetical protein
MARSGSWVGVVFWPTDDIQRNSLISVAAGQADFKMKISGIQPARGSGMPDNSDRRLADEL